MTNLHRITIGGPAPQSATARPGPLEDYLTGALEVEIEAARAEGHADGHAEALAGAAAVLSQAAEDFDAGREECASEVSRAAVELGIEIARRLVRSELSTDRHDIEAIVREVLASSTGSRTTTRIHVSPSDAERLSEVTFRAATELVPDEGVPIGSVRVETPQGVIVRDIDECMLAIATRLTQEVSK